MGAGLATARGLEIAGFESDGVTFLTVTALGGAAFFAIGLAGDFALTFATGFVVFAGLAFATDLTTGLGATFATPLGSTAPTGLATAFAGALLSTLTNGLPGLVTGFSLGLAAAVAFTLIFVAAALLSFPDLAFTSCLLAEISCAWSVGPATPALPLTGFFGWASSARECTGFPMAKPIRCKIETIIWIPSH